MIFRQSSETKVFSSLMTKVVILNSTAINSPGYIYDVIRQSLWLLKANHDIVKVKVYLHPVQILPTPLSVINYIKHEPFPLLSRSAKAIPTVTKKILSFLGLRPLNHDKSSSFFEKICSNSISSINSKYGVVEFCYYKEIIRFDFAQSLKLDIRAVKLLNSTKSNGILNPQLLLNLKYRGVLIGDLVASTALRSCENAGGRIKYCTNLLFILAKAIAIVDYFSDFMRTASYSDAYVSAPEPTYIHSIYSRLGLRLGASIVETNSYNEKLYLSMPNTCRMNPKVVRNVGNSNLTSVHKLEVERHMNDRLFSEKSPLWYMFNGSNDQNIEAITNIYGKEIDLSESNFVAAVFLHSFEDGQYFYGLDGFDDLYHWTTSTLDALISNPLISKILLKPHPNANYSTYKADKVAVKNLISTYRHPKIHWLNPRTSVPLLSTVKHLIGITHHGSVAEELTYLGVPVIGCGNASPWMSNFDFVHTWNSPEEYFEMLNNLDESSFVKTSMLPSLSLYRYIHEYRINVCSQHESKPWLIFSRLNSTDLPEISLANYRKVESALRSLCQTDKNFVSFIEEIARSLPNTSAKLTQ